ncbi:hypothetical protein ACFVIY_11040 [Streptomyces sp. NPDC127166]|uniref:restriction endonuclease subunit S n=1 Tax=Streptomyces sp. NPDC127166 TaxID=3345380 RepID=UPI00364147D4
MSGELTGMVRLDHYLDGPIRNGFSPVESADWTGVQMLGLGCLTTDGFEPRQLKNAPHGIRSDHAALLRDGDLLLSRANTRALVGLVGRYRDIGSPCIYPDLMMRLIPNDRCVPDFLEHLLTSAPVRRRIMASAQGTSESMVKISADSVKQLKVPLFSVADQQRAVEVLDAFDARVEAEIGALRKELSLWDGVINGQLSWHAQKFGTSSLRDVSHGGGAYGSNAAAVASDLRMPRYVRITDIDDQGKLSTDASAAVSIPWESARQYLLSEGDLLIARTGFTTGKTYLYQPEDGVCAFAGYLVRFRINPERMLPEYAFLWTRGQAFATWVARNVREVGQRNISAREYNQHQVAVPPLDVQEELVRAWRAARASHSLRQLEIERLRVLRQAVSVDLLSGKVRVGDVA